MSGKVVDRDRGYHAILHDLTQAVRGAPRVFVGILQDKGAEYAEGGKITLAGYAAVNEFGSEDGHVPERSFLRSTVDDNRAAYGKALEKCVDELIEGARTGVPGAGLRRMGRALGLLGARALRDVQRKIRDLREPPNAPSTLAKKYPGDNPLIHTGRMRQSISFLVDMSGAAGGPAVQVTRKAGAS